MTEQLISYHFEIMPEFQPDKIAGGKSMQQLRQDQDKVWQVYKLEGNPKNKQIMGEYLSYNEADELCNSLNNS